MSTLTHRRDSIQKIRSLYKEMEQRPSEKNRIHKQIDEVCKMMVKFK